MISKTDLLLKDPYPANIERIKAFMTARLAPGVWVLVVGHLESPGG